MCGVLVSTWILPAACSVLCMCNSQQRWGRSKMSHSLAKSLLACVHDDKLDTRKTLHYKHYIPVQNGPNRTLNNCTWSKLRLIQKDSNTERPPTLATVCCSDRYEQLCDQTWFRVHLDPLWYLIRLTTSQTTYIIGQVSGTTNWVYPLWQLY